MNDISPSHSEDDPLAAAPALTAADVEAMRRRVLSVHRAPTSQGWTWTLTLAAALVAVVVAGLGVTRRVQPGGVAATARPDEVAHGNANDARRQLQFATPGGTRVIWVFNADFETR
jgi:hypothetical protein